MILLTLPASQLLLFRPPSGGLLRRRSEPVSRTQNNVLDSVEARRLRVSLSVRSSSSPRESREIRPVAVFDGFRLQTFAACSDAEMESSGGWYNTRRQYRSVAFGTWKVGGARQLSQRSQVNLDKT